MESTASGALSLAALVRRDLLPMLGIAKLAPCRRFTSLFSADSHADSVFFLESGLVKLVKRGDQGKEIVVSLIAPGELFGEQGLVSSTTRGIGAEMLETGTVHVIPRDVFLNFCETHPEVWKMLAEVSFRRLRDLERKVELLCLKDVEQRILLTLADLARSIGQAIPGGTEYSIPLSQSELASLIGATRETTSTTLNQLERRQLLHLGRRLLVISSIDGMLQAADQAPRAMAKASV